MKIILFIISEINLIVLYMEGNCLDRCDGLWFKLFFKGLVVMVFLGNNGVFRRVVGDRERMLGYYRLCI